MKCSTFKTGAVQRFMCKQKAYPMWLSYQHKKYPIEREYNPSLTEFNRNPLLKKRPGLVFKVLIYR